MTNRPCRLIAIAEESKSVLCSATVSLESANDQHRKSTSPIRRRTIGVGRLRPGEVRSQPIGPVTRLPPVDWTSPNVSEENVDLRATIDDAVVMLHIQIPETAGRSPGLFRYQVEFASEDHETSLNLLVLGELVAP